MVFFFSLNLKLFVKCIIRILAQPSPQITHGEHQRAGGNMESSYIWVTWFSDTLLKTKLGCDTTLPTTATIKPVVKWSLWQKSSTKNHWTWSGYNFCNGVLWDYPRWAYNKTSLSSRSGKRPLPDSPSVCWGFPVLGLGLQKQEWQRVSRARWADGRVRTWKTALFGLRMLAFSKGSPVTTKTKCAMTKGNLPRSRDRSVSIPDTRFIIHHLLITAAPKK